MKHTVDKQIMYTLILDADEAEILRAIVQNSVFESESHEENEFRLRLFNALAPVDQS